MFQVIQSVVNTKVSWEHMHCVLNAFWDLFTKLLRCLDHLWLRCFVLRAHEALATFEGLPTEFYVTSCSLNWTLKQTGDLTNTVHLELIKNTIPTILSIFVNVTLNRVCVTTVFHDIMKTTSSCEEKQSSDTKTQDKFLEEIKYIWI